MTTNYSDPDSININGPINIIRLEGIVNNIKKVIYVFMDFHFDVTEQSQCSNIFSEDVNKYFLKTFYNLSKNESIDKYDFFVEIYPTEILNNFNNYYEYRDNYIIEIIKLFKKIVKFDKDNNKVIFNELFRNIRLHFLDIRNYYTHKKYIESDLINHIKKIKKSNNITMIDIEKIINYLNDVKYNIDYFLKILRQKKYDIEKKIIINHPEKNIFDESLMNYLINKMKNKYKNNNIKKIMNELIIESIVKFDQSLKIINNTIKKIEKYMDELSNNNVKEKLVHSYESDKKITDIINIVITIIYDHYEELFARFTDIFFLRRFLDKDYIKNSIVYTGAFHSNMYIHTLINKFDFKITHASYSKYSIDKLNMEIKKSSLIESKNLIFPPKLIQCSTMNDFPKNFN